MLESLRTNKYQYSAGFMTADSLSSRKLGAINADIVVESRGKKRFLKDSFSLVVVVGRRLRSCSQNLPTSGYSNA